MGRLFRPSVGRLRRVLLALMVLTAVYVTLCLFRGGPLSWNRPTFNQLKTAYQTSLQKFRTLTVTVDKTQDASDGVKCVHPPLHPYDPAIMQYYAKQHPIDCTSAMEDWVYVINGTFHISSDAIRHYGKITCKYSPFFRNGDYAVRYGAPVRPMLDGMLLQSDFFHVFCESASGKKYTNIHAAVAWSNDIMRRLRQYRSSAKYMGGPDKPHSLWSEASLSANGQTDHGASSLSNLSVFMFSLDSMSRMGWHRNLPKLRKYFGDNLGAIELENYNIMGDGTQSALFPILTGKLKEELPEARQAVNGGKPVDNHPWIWKELSKHGYVTAFAQDGGAKRGVFHWNMRGFQNQPTDHYMHPFYVETEHTHLRSPPLCWGSKPRHTCFMNWFGSLLDMYKDFPKFFFGHYLDISHDHINRVQAMDDDFVAFLQDLELKGHLNSTLMILMGDHGPRFTQFRQTTQGILEGRLPYFAFRFPPWFQQLHPEIIKNMHTNTKRLTTPLDIHATLQDILNYSNSKVGDVRNRAHSLFQEIPKDRTCTQAAITPHWCACLVWELVNRSDPLVKQAVDKVIKTINSYTKSDRTKCAELTLHEITKSVRYVPSSEDLSAERRLKKYSDPNSPPPKATAMFQVSFKTLPGQGHYEVTCELDVQSRRFSVRGEQISRINRYGSEPACIEKYKPHLRPYCYCVQ